MKLFNIFSFLKKDSHNLESSTTKNSHPENLKIGKITLNQMEKELETIDTSKQTKTKRI